MSSVADVGMRRAQLCVLNYNFGELLLLFLLIPRWTLTSLVWQSKLDQPWFVGDSCVGLGCWDSTDSWAGGTVREQALYFTSLTFLTFHGFL